MVYIEIDNLADQYTAWRKEVLEKQGKKPGHTGDSSTAGAPLTWAQWQRKAEAASKQLIKDVKKGKQR